MSTVLKTQQKAEPTDGLPKGFIRATIEEVEKATKKLVNGRAKVVFFKPLYAPLIFRLVIKAAQWLPTMATDGKSLMFNPKFILELPIDHLKFAILHEIFHCVMRHPSRRGNRNPDIWNIATDLLINGILVFQEALEHPAWIVLDKKYFGKGPDGTEWTAEKIYDDLMKDAEAAKQKFKIKCACVQRDPTAKDGSGGQTPEDAAGKGDGKDAKKGDKPGDGKGGAGKDGDPQDGKDGADGEGGGQGGDQEPVFSDPRGWTDVKWDRDTEEDWKQAAIQTEQMARMKGNAPAWLTTLVDELVEPPVPIEKLLQHLVGNHISQETTWRTPNRRFISRKIILPSTMRDKKDIVMIFDTSGSIADAEGRKFMGLAQRAMKSKGIHEMRLIQCDMAINDDCRIKDVSTYKLHIRRTGFKGRGGTSFKPPFELLREEKALWNTACIMYLTDLCGDFPEWSPKCPVFWFTTSPGTKAPFGKTFHWDIATDRLTVVHGPKVDVN